MSERPTVHEMMELNEMLRVEAIGARQGVALVPLIGDPGLREWMEASLGRCKAHANVLVEFCKTHQLVQ